MKRIVFLLAVVFSGITLAGPAEDIEVLLKQKNLKALPAAQALIKAEPKNSNAWVLLTRAHLLNKDNEKGIDAAEKAVKLGPQSAQAYYWLGNSFGRRIGEVGTISQMMMAPKLRDAFESAIKYDPTIVDARMSLMQFYLQAPSIMGGGIDKAKAQAKTIATYSAADGHLAQAMIYRSEKKADESIREYELAHKLRPDDRGLRMTLGMAYQITKRWDQAFAYYDVWIMQKPEDAAPYYQLGRSAAESGLQLDKGLQALTKYQTMKLEENDPELQHALFRIGQIYEQQGKRDLAKQSYAKALKLDPKLTAAKDALSKMAP